MSAAQQPSPNGPSPTPEPAELRVTPPDGFQTCNVYRDSAQTNHLVRWVNGGTPGPTVCGLTRFDSAPGARDADLPGWGMGGGVFGPNVQQVRCPGCWEAASAE